MKKVSFSHNLQFSGILGTTDFSSYYVPIANYPEESNEIVKKNNKNNKNNKNLINKDNLNKLLSTKEDKLLINNEGKNNKKNHVYGLKILFGEDSNKWSYDDDNLFLITPFYISKKIAELANSIFNNNNYLSFDKDHSLNKDDLLIWDMFSGIGTDSLQLAEYFKIITTELNTNTYQLLVKNIYSFNKENQII